MKMYKALFVIGFLIPQIFSKPSSAMEIIFGRKYPIAQKTALDQLNWLSVEFEKDITGKVIYKLEATHPEGKKISYLKGKDYLLSEDIQKNMVRNFEVKVPEVEFGPDQKAIIEIVLPYDFQTRYLPIRFEKPNGYQEVVLRLRFGDYRFMLASRVLNTVSFVETAPVIAAKSLDQLFMRRSQLKKRAPKEVVAEQVANVQVDDIYNDIKADLKIESRIGTSVEEALAVDSSEQVMDDFDSLLNKYAPVEESNIAINKDALNATGKSLNVKGSEISFEDSQNQGAFSASDLSKDLKANNDHDAFIDDLVKEAQNIEFSAEATIEDIIAQAGNLEQYADDTEVGVEQEGYEIVTENETTDSQLDSENQVANVKPKKTYIPAVDTEALFGFAADNWVEPKSAPVLVMKPKPVDQKRRIASFEPPKRNNFVEFVPAKKTAPAKGVNMDDLFGGGNDSGANPSGFGF
jgi:hypothetical protein